MDPIRSSSIIPLAFYCFCLGFYFFVLGLNTILGSTVDLTKTDLMFWLPVGASAILGSALFYVGRGILKLQLLSWKILFFTLAMSVSSIASLIFAFLIFLLLGENIIYVYFHVIQIPLVSLYSFLGVFLSEIIVLYYLTRGDVVASFGDMGDLISPF